MPHPGEIFKQPDLARSLREIAAHGADALYKGEIGDRIDKFFRANGGVLGKDDLEGYQALWLKPISTTYHGYTFYTQPPSSSGIAVWSN